MRPFSCEPLDALRACYPPGLASSCHAAFPGVGGAKSPGLWRNHATTTCPRCFVRTPGEVAPRGSRVPGAVRSGLGWTMVAKTVVLSPRLDPAPGRTLPFAACGTPRTGRCGEWSGASRCPGDARGVGVIRPGWAWISAIAPSLTPLRGGG